MTQHLGLPVRDLEHLASPNRKLLSGPSDCPAGRLQRARVGPAPSHLQYYRVTADKGAVKFSFGIRKRSRPTLESCDDLVGPSDIPLCTDLVEDEASSDGGLESTPVFLVVSNDRGLCYVDK